MSTAVVHTQNNTSYPKLKKKKTVSVQSSLSLTSLTEVLPRLAHYSQAVFTLHWKSAMTSAFHFIHTDKHLHTYTGLRHLLYRTLYLLCGESDFTFTLAIMTSSNSLSLYTHIFLSVHFLFCLVTVLWKPLLLSVYKIV